MGLWDDDLLGLIACSHAGSAGLYVLMNTFEDICVRVEAGSTSFYPDEYGYFNAPVKANELISLKDAMDDYLEEVDDA